MPRPVFIILSADVSEMLQKIADAEGITPSEVAIRLIIAEYERIFGKAK